MSRQGKTIKRGRAGSASFVLPALVLVAVFGVAAALEFGSDAAHETDPPMPASVVASPPRPTPAVSRITPDAPLAEPEAPVVEPEQFIPPPPLPMASPPADPQAGVRAGREGLVEALRRGELRVGSAADLERWAEIARTTGRAVDSRRLQESMRDVYVVRQDVVVPPGLNGAHAVIFVLERGAPHPRGDVGHSMILDLQSGACEGLTCGMLLGH